MHRGSNEGGGDGVRGGGGVSGPATLPAHGFVHQSGSSPKAHHSEFLNFFLSFFLNQGFIT